jgi:hypothetical protein
LEEFMLEAGAWVWRLAESGSGPPEITMLGM